MSELFGAKYFGFILSAYGITAVVLVMMTLWILVVHKMRQQKLAELEKAGMKRAGRSNG